MFGIGYVCTNPPILIERKRVIKNTNLVTPLEIKLTSLTLRQEEKRLAALDCLNVSSCSQIVNLKLIQYSPPIIADSQ